MAVCKQPIFLSLFKEYSYCNTALSKRQNHRVSCSQGGDIPYTLLKCLLAEALNKMENIILRKEHNPIFLERVMTLLQAYLLSMLTPLFLHARL